MSALHPERQSNRQQIYNCFKLLAEGRHNSTQLMERRSSERVNYPFPVYLTPVENGSDAMLDESFGVIGRHLSDRGFDFYHREPISHRFVIASFEFSPSRFVGIRMRLNWCRFGRHGYFENGGEFLNVEDSPLGMGPFDG